MALLVGGLAHALFSFAGVDVARAQTVLHVAPSGQPGRAGSPESPLSFEGAMGRIAAMLGAEGVPEDGVLVRVRGGRYEFIEPFVLDERFDGNRERPIVIQAATGEHVMFDGSVRIDPGGFAPVTDPEERARLAASAVDHVLVQTLDDTALIAGLESELILGLTSMG